MSSLIPTESATLLDLHRPELASVAVVGCGGKSTFIESLARSLPHKRILITPTTKIRPIIARDVTLCPSLDAARQHRPHQGIQCMGQHNSTTGKLEALPLDFLASIRHHYDLLLLEADGSRGLPCKGWHHYEPVIPDFVTHTVAIMTLEALHQEATSAHVCHLEAFLRITELKAHAPITLKALYRMITHQEGLWQYSKGTKAFLLNRIESQEQQSIARDFLSYLQQHDPSVSCYAYGRAKENYWQGVS